MIFVTGGAYAGKRTWVARALGVPEREIAQGRLDGCRAVSDAQTLARTMPLDALVDALAEKDVVIATEIGAGIVPLDEGERAWREAAGRLACALAERASAVVRVTCGVGTLLKGALPAATARPIAVSLMRHGATAGNLARRYVGGATDEGLSPEGAAAVEDAATRMAFSERAVARVYTSGMLRCAQTARIAYPLSEQISVPGLREMEFGDFEGRSADEMAEDAAYRAWVEGWCEGECPNGESRARFVERTVRAFLSVMDEVSAHGDARADFVVHGGTIKALVSALSEEPTDYFSVEAAPGERWTATFANGSLSGCERRGA